MTFGAKVGHSKHQPSLWTEPLLPELKESQYIIDLKVILFPEILLSSHQGSRQLEGDKTWGTKIALRSKMC